MDFDYLAQLFLLTARHAALFLLVPAFSLRALPAPVRIGLALLVTVAILPPGTVPESPVPLDYTFFFALAKEILVGLVAGFGVMLVFAAFQAAGAMVGVQLGLGLPAILNPQFENQDTTLESFYNMVAVFLFLVIDAHHKLLAALVSLHRGIPVDSFALTAVTREGMLELGALFFGTALRVAFPVLAAMLLADVALGLVARLAPQMQAFYVGIPAKVGLGLLVLVLTFPGLVSVMTGVFDTSVRDVLRLFARA